MPRTSQTDRQRARRSDGEFVQGLQRGFSVVRAFSAASPVLSIAEVAERTALTRAVARRYLLTLEVLGYVGHEGRGYFLTPRMLDLGFTYLSTIGVADVAQPFMERVAETLHESCSVGVLDGLDVIYVARMPAKRIMSVNLVVGSRLPAHATAMGKVLLAALSPAELEAYFATAVLERRAKNTICSGRVLRAALRDVRRLGWALADEESEDGVRAVAAPLFDRFQSVVAAVNVSSHASRASTKDLRHRFLPVLLDAARQISTALGARRAGEPRSASLARAAK